MVLDQRLRVIDQDFHRNPAEPQECAFHPFEPVGLALPLRGPDMHPARIAERGDKHMDPHPLAANPHLRITEVDLHLVTGRGLEANCRPLLRLQLASPLANPKLDRAQSDDDPVLARQFPSDDAATKLLYLILNRSEKEWKMPPREWSMARAQFAVIFGERFIRAMAA